MRGRRKNVGIYGRSERMAREKNFKFIYVYILY